MFIFASKQYLINENSKCELKNAHEVEMLDFFRNRSGSWLKPTASEIKA